MLSRIKARIDAAFSSFEAYDVRADEYARAVEFLQGCKTVLDVGCGTGTFLQAWKGDGEGVDFNPENVAHAQARGLKVRTGDARELPFESNSFDGVHCSHLLQVFHSDDAVKVLKEALRVVRKQGVVVITTLNWFPRFFRHPENARPYPPDAIQRLALTQTGSTSPMYEGIEGFAQEAIWLRRPPLVELFSVRPPRNYYCARLNDLQLHLGLRKFWTYDAYTVKLRVSKASRATS